jgi:CheY-like chemotaxis protein
MPNAKLLQPIGNSWIPAVPKVLIVDDDDLVLETVGLTLSRSGFRVVAASSVKDALRYVTSETFEVLISDLHMPSPGDGLTVVSAMRHFHPTAVTILLTAFPEMTEAANAILKQTDAVLVKPVQVDTLVGTITDRLRQGASLPRIVESVATILERETQATIEDWLGCVDIDPLVSIIPLDENVRCAHLPQLFRELVFRLRHPLPLGRRALSSPAAVEHGLQRRRQGYSAVMLVEESRMLQVSIFQTLQDNLHKVDFNVLLVSVMAIADEVDSQLAQAVEGYISESKPEGATSHANV